MERRTFIKTLASALALGGVPGYSAEESGTEESGSGPERAYCTGHHPYFTAVPEHTHSVALPEDVREIDPDLVELPDHTHGYGYLGDCEICGKPKL